MRSVGRSLKVRVLTYLYKRCIQDTPNILISTGAGELKMESTPVTLDIVSTHMTTATVKPRGDPVIIDNVTVEISDCNT